MNIVIAGNHSILNSTGGCEKVISQISENLFKKFGHNCSVLTSSYKDFPRVHKGVIYENAGRTSHEFFSKIKNKKTEHLFIYSDVFSFWKDIVINCEKINCGKSIALVGMNSMLNDFRLFSQFVKKKDQFSVITHSKNYIDYRMCYKNKIIVNVIPNGVDINEFNVETGSFRKKYNIAEENIILCVSNFFPGKGQDFLVPIIKKVQNKSKDNIFVFICSSFNLPFDKFLKNQFYLNAKNSGINFRLLCDISREDTIAAFTDADIFVFSSQKEVAPLVILESMASRTPWISMPVGNIVELDGGMVIENKNKDMNNNFMYNEEINERFLEALLSLLENKERREELSMAGRKQIEKDFSFDIIIEKYNEIFTK